MELLEFMTRTLGENTIGGIVLAAFFTVLGIMLKGILSNHGQITVAKINSDTTLGTKAMETLTTALEVLQEENRSLKANIKQLESHIEILIEHILHLVKADSQQEIEKATQRLEQFLKAIGRWPY